MNMCKTMYENFAKLLKDSPQKRFYDWMLANGKEFKGRKLTRVEEHWLQQRVSKKLYTLGMCILQSQVGCADGTLHYYEGQATTESLGIPLEHAWLVDAEGKVWDSTWKDGADYFGVEIPSDFVRKNMLETGEAQGLVAKYWQAFNPPSVFFRDIKHQTLKELKMSESHKKKILFICAANYGRSPTGEDLVNSIVGGAFEAKSAGVFVGATKEVTQELLDWAETVFVMEEYQKVWLSRYTVTDKIVVLDIPDRYGYGEPELIEILRRKLLAHGIDTTRAEFKPTRPVFSLADIYPTVWYNVP